MAFIVSLPSALSIPEKQIKKNIKNQDTSRAGNRFWRGNKKETTARIKKALPLTADNSERLCSASPTQGTMCREDCMGRTKTQCPSGFCHIVPGNHEFCLSLEIREL